MIHLTVSFEKGREKKREGGGERNRKIKNRKRQIDI
jgi:hypothetical protein